MKNWLRVVPLMVAILISIPLLMSGCRSKDQDLPKIADAHGKDDARPKVVVTDVESGRSDPQQRAFHPCDSFIEVHWISTARAIGATEYDLVDKAGRTRHVQALVHLGADRPKMNYRQTLIPLPVDSGNGWPQRDVLARSQVGESVIRSWELTTGHRGGAIWFANGTQNLSVERDTWQFGESLAGGKKSVCMWYPDRSRAWIIELTSALERYGDRTKYRYAEVTRNIPESDTMRPSLERFAEAGVIDVNHDGLDDYPSLGILSYRGAYSTLRRSSDREQELEEFGRLVFGGSGATCEQDPPDAFFLVTDGPSVYLNRKCNLTQLSSKEK